MEYGKKGSVETEDFDGNSKKGRWRMKTIGVWKGSLMWMLSTGVHRKEC